MTDGHETIIHELQGVSARLGGNTSRGNGSSANEDMLFICRSILRRLQDSGGGDDPPVTPSMLNAQKLALTLVPAAQQADTFAITNAGSTEVNGIWIKDVAFGLFNGKSIWRKCDNSDWVISWNGDSAWEIQTDATRYAGPENVDVPWLVVTWVRTGVYNGDNLTGAAPVPTLVHPALGLIDYGQSVKVTDAFVLHDSIYGDVFYYTNGTALSGGTVPAIEKYSPANRLDLDDITWRWNNANDASQGGAWGDSGGNYAGLGDASVTHFWDTPVESIDHNYTFTHPPVQTLAYPDPSREEFWTADGLLHVLYERDENGLIYRDENGAPVVLS